MRIVSEAHYTCNSEQNSEQRIMSISLPPLFLLRPCHQGVWDLSMPPLIPSIVLHMAGSLSSGVAIPIFFSTTKVGLYRGRGRGKGLK